MEIAMTWRDEKIVHGLLQFLAETGGREAGVLLYNLLVAHNYASGRPRMPGPKK